METELILLRHGETDWNKELKFQGQQDIPLNEKGIEQANQVSRYLKNKEINLIITSDLKRSEKTAAIIATAKDLEIKKIAGLREISFGEWEGLTYQQIEKRNPKRLASWVKSPTSISPPFGETLLEFKKRINSSFSQLIKNNTGKKILVVSHGGTIRIYLSSLLEMPLKANWKLGVDNTAISIVKFYDQDPVLTVLNSKAHLEN